MRIVINDQELEDQMLHIIKNLSGDVIVRGKPKEATGETTVRIEPRIEIRSGLDSKMKLEELL